MQVGNWNWWRTCIRNFFYNVVPSCEETSFWPPSMVYISVIIIHITQYIHHIWIFILKNCPFPGFEPGSSRYEADSIPMCYRALVVLGTLVSDIWLQLWVCESPTHKSEIQRNNTLMQLQMGKWTSQMVEENMRLTLEFPSSCIHQMHLGFSNFNDRWWILIQTNLLTKQIF